MNVAIFICYVGVVSAVCQTGLLSALIRRLGAKRSIMVHTALPFLIEIEKALVGSFSRL